MTDYRSRVVEGKLSTRMMAIGAVLIDGPKAVGKTRTAEEIARTVLRMNFDRAARAALEIAPEQLFASPTPIVFDERQKAPELWNLVRRAVDDQDGKGLYILTGASRPRDDTHMHSGARRIARLRMRPMRLYENGHSSGEVTLQRVLDGEDPAGAGSGLDIDCLLERIVIGGWPDLLDGREREASVWLRDYLRTIAEADVPGLGPRRNPGNIEPLMAALGGGTATPLNLSSVAEDVGVNRDRIAAETMTNYLDALDRLMLIEPIPA